MKKNIVVFLVLLIMMSISFFVYVKTKTPNTLEGKAYYGATLGGGYLLRHINKDGSFVYEYNAKEDNISPKYNMLRHAGTVYALLELYSVTRNKDYLNASEKALKYLKNNISKCPKPNSDLYCVYEGEKMKLGGNALAILAFTEYQKVTKSEKYLSDVTALAKWIIKTQSKEGEFKVHSQLKDGTITDAISEYYPGEAIYALMNMYEVTNDETYLNSAKKAVNWIVNVRDDGKTSKDISHDHWLLYGIRELYKYSPSKEHVEHVKKIVDGIVNLQHTKNVPAEWVGGYYNPPRSTPTATRGEALSSAYEIFKSANEYEYAEMAYKTLQRGVIFELRTLIDGKKTRSYPNPIKSLGGFRASLKSDIVRIDYVQHNISSLLGYYRITNEINSSI